MDLAGMNDVKGGYLTLGYVFYGSSFSGRPSLSQACLGVTLVRTAHPTGVVGWRGSD